MLTNLIYTVGLDVDIICVSFLIVRSVIIIWLYAGNLLNFVCPFHVDGIIKQNHLLIYLINKKIELLRNYPIGGDNNNKIKELSAGNLEVEEGFEDVSEHQQKHKKPEDDSDLGYYLAGLIEGDGYIGERGFEVIFHESDVATAYYIKKRIGYGSISKVKDKKACKLSIFHKKGVERV